MQVWRPLSPLTIVNAGIIRAKAGRVELAAGTRATLDLYGDGLVELAVEEEALSQTILNTGLIEAQGGQVHLSAAAAKTLVDNLILNSGVVRATAIGRDEAGQIVLMAEGGGVINSGVLDASGRQEGQRGGQIEVLGITSPCWKARSLTLPVIPPPPTMSS